MSARFSLSGCAAAVLIFAAGGDSWAQRLVEEPAKPPAPQPAVPDAKQKAVEAEQAAIAAKLEAGAKLGSQWMDKLKAGDVSGGLKLWGGPAFAAASKPAVEKQLTTQQAELGALQSARLQRERSVVDLAGTAGEKGRESKGVLVTLVYFSRYARQPQREYLVVHEPAKGGGMKIIGLRREELPAGKQGAFDLGACLGQMALLRINHAPVERWEPYMDEARVHAQSLKLTLPDLPAANNENEDAGSELMEALMDRGDVMLEPLGDAGGRDEAALIMRAYALLSVYDPGETLCAQLANLVSERARQASVPGDLWQPLVRAVLDKAPRSTIAGHVHDMSTNISRHLAEHQRVADLAAGAKNLLARALENMAGLPSYQVRADLTAGDRTARMEASLALDGMDLKLEGFDGRKQRRIVAGGGFWVSSDDGKSWQEDPDKESAVGLCRTLTAPVDPGFKIHEKHPFALKGEEEIDGEKLLRIDREDPAHKEPMTYWILISKKGPVVRRAALPMSFGDIDASAVIRYLKLGRPIEIKPPVEK